MTLQRRRIFVNLGQIAEISVDGAHLRGGSVELDRFTRRTGEILASELYGQRTSRTGPSSTSPSAPASNSGVGWEVSALAVSHGRSLLHRGPEIVPWDEYPELFKTDPLAEQLAELRELQPADLATPSRACRRRRGQIAAALDDEELADLLEEMPEQDQVRMLASLGLERSADVVEEMQPDDAADLLGRAAGRAARTAADRDGAVRPRTCGGCCATARRRRAA